MRAYAGEVKLERRCPLLFGGGIHIVRVGGERDLRVNDKVAAAGKKNDDVGTRGLQLFAIFGGEAGEALLEAVLFAFAKTGFLKQVAQDELAPVALRLG